jgi:hypothetical protein
MGLYLLFYVAFVWHVGFVFHAMREAATNGLSKGLGSLYVEFLQHQSSLLLALVLILPPILYDLLKFSNRIAGPLYRCRNVMRQIADGESVPEFEPRKGDQFREFFQTFNALIKVWNARLGAAEPRAEETPGPLDTSCAAPDRALTP